MKFLKLDVHNFTKSYFNQMIHLEKTCGLEPFSPQMIKQCVAHMDTFAFVEEQKLIGFITIHPSARYSGGGLYVVNLNVAEEHRRQGIGARLILAACSAYGMTHEGQRVVLDVNKENAPAIALYEKMGFAKTDEPSENGPSDMVMAVDLNTLLGIRITQRLMLKRLTRLDTPAGIEILMDDIIKKTYMLPDLTEETAQKLFDRMCGLSQIEDRYIRGIYLKDQLIGFINDPEILEDSIELGWVIHPRYHNQGYASEAVKGAIADLFSRGYREVTAGAFIENPASIRVMQKCGMKKVEKTEEIDYRGKTHHCIFYAIGRETQ